AAGPLVIAMATVTAIAWALLAFRGECSAKNYSEAGTRTEPLARGLDSAAGEPRIVAGTLMAEIAGIIESDISAIIITSGGITVLIFPFIANIILSKKV